MSFFLRLFRGHMSHVVNSLPTHGVYLFPRFLRRAFYRLPLNYRLFPLVGPSIVKLMINYAVYNNYNKVLVAGDHDSDLTKLKGNRNKWGRSYNYFFPSQIISGIQATICKLLKKLFIRTI